MEISRNFCTVDVYFKILKKMIKLIYVRDTKISLSFVVRDAWVESNKVFRPNYIIQIHYITLLIEK